jgi:hypothetical protein
MSNLYRRRGQKGFPMRLLLRRLMLKKILRPCAALAATLASLGGAAHAESNYHGVDLYALQLPAGFSSQYRFPDLYHSHAVGQTAGAAYVTGQTDQIRALLWRSNGTVVDLGANFPSVQSAGASTDGAQQVGGIGNDAYLWSGNAKSGVNLNPVNLTTLEGSFANGVGGGQQAGTGYTSNGFHALVWSGTGASAVDLHPNASYQYSEALATDGVWQAGYAIGSAYYPYIWNGSAASAIDLSPPPPLDIRNAQALFISGQQTVGIGAAGNGFARGVVWLSRTPGSAVSLDPDLSLGTLAWTSAYGTNGSWQVGVVSGTGVNMQPHASAWAGTADSWQDLHTLLPSGFTDSVALTIDSAGNIYGYATDTSGTIHAVEWSVPEPGAPAMILLAAAARILRRNHGDGDDLKPRR